MPIKIDSNNYLSFPVILSTHNENGDVKEQWGFNSVKYAREYANTLSEEMMAITNYEGTRQWYFVDGKWGYSN